MAPVQAGDPRPARQYGAAMISLIVTYYDQPLMLARQLREWAAYPEHVRRHFRFVVVDDGSPTHPAFDTIRIHGYEDMTVPLTLYRIDTDISWNNHGARNLAAQESPDPWLLMLDIDHVLTAENAARLYDYVLGYAHLTEWHRFPRERIGAADDTRAKDATLRGIDPTLSRVPVNPHCNSFLVSRDAYWRAGGYNESFCGTYGGDAEFLRELRHVAGDPVELSDVWLQVHTRDSVPDANIAGLNRDPAPFREKLAWAKRANMVKGHPPYCRFPWRRVL